MLLMWSSLLSLPLPFVLTFLGTMVLTAIIYLKTLLKAPDNLPRLYYKESGLSQYIIDKCKFSMRPFRPSLFLRNAHVQTLMSSILPSCPVEFHRQYLQMQDNGVVALDWIIDTANSFKKRSPIVIIIPNEGLDASSVGHLCKAAIEKKYRTLAFIKRGHAGIVLTTPKLQSFGDPSDFRQVVEYIHARYPSAAITTVAVGRSCSTLLSYLGEFGSSAGITAAVCISPCYDPLVAYQKHLGGIYPIALLLKEKWRLLGNAKALASVIDVKAAICSRNFNHFAREVYCEMYNQSDVDEFWDKNYPMRDADDISTPILCINSLDDPVCPKESIPFDLFHYYPNFFLIVTEKGGNCGFLENLNSPSWVTNVVLEYLSSVIAFSKPWRGSRPRSRTK